MGDFPSLLLVEILWAASVGKLLFEKQRTQLQWGDQTPKCPLLPWDLFGGATKDDFGEREL